MLVLGRKLNSKLVLRLEDGREIRIQVTRLSNSWVGLGIDAPHTVQIHRGEAIDKRPKVR